MSTSGRGPPPHYNEYQDYGKSRRKNFYSSSLSPNPQNRRDFTAAAPGPELVLTDSNSRNYSARKRTNSHDSFTPSLSHPQPLPAADGWNRFYPQRNSGVLHKHQTPSGKSQPPANRSTLNTTRGKRDNNHPHPQSPGKGDQYQPNSLHQWAPRLPVPSTKPLSGEEITAVAVAALEAFTARGPNPAMLDNDDDDDIQDETPEPPPLQPEFEAKPVVAKLPVIDVTLRAGDLLELEVAYTTAYPLTLIDTRYKDLVEEFHRTMPKDDGGKPFLKYSPVKPIKSLIDYPCYYRNISKFKQSKHSQLLLVLKQKHDHLRAKRIKLVREYQVRNRNWQREREWMDQQLQLLHPPDDEMRREIDSLDMRKQQSLPIIPVEPEPVPEQLPQSSRRSRGRRGDLVASEAEFQEILQSLGKELDEDPVLRAERHAAPIPDLILDPVERYHVKFMDSNNVVRDKIEWALRVKTDFIDNFSELEHKLFCEAWCLYPKKFGAISRHIGGLRTALDCVVHYYATKKQVNYKQLLVQYKKKAAAARKNRKSKSLRSRSSPQSQTSEMSPSGNPQVTEAFEPPISGLLANHDDDDDDDEEAKIRKRSIAAKDEKNKKRRKKDDETVVPGTHSIPISTMVSDDTMVKSEVPIMNQALETTLGYEEADPTDDDKRRIILSYWSITEILMFPDLLLKYGSKWESIAEELLTKSAVMVRNYFLRNADKHNWGLIVEMVDKGVNLPLGLFTHRPPPPIHVEQLAKVNINLLLSDASSTQTTVVAPAIAAPVPEKPQAAAAPIPPPPVRSSIMSLLNTETESNPAVVVPAHHQNRLLDLLNSLPAPQLPVVVAPSRSSKHKLADLLSAEPN